jgi:Dolichyl-phosphate-mannose-protein mannosyltransferase
VNAGAASLPVRRALTAAVSREVAAITALAATTVALLAATWETWGNVGQDTGYDFVAGQLVAHGSFPYTDFTYYYGPLAPAVLGLAAGVGGDGIGPPLVVGLVLTAAIVAATYVLARQLTSAIGALLAATITAGVAFAPTNFSFVDPHSYSETLGILTTLAFLIALGRRTQGGGRVWVAAAGLAAGLTMLTRPEFAAAVALAGVAWIAYGRLRRPEILLLGAPAAAIAILVYGVLAARAGVHRLLFENLYPVDQLRAAGDHVLRIQAPLTAHSFIELGLRAGVYVAGAAALVAVGLTLDSRRLRVPAWTAITVAAAGLAAAMAIRIDTVTYYLLYPYAWIPAGAAAGVIVLALRARRRPAADDRLALAVAVVLAVLAVKTYAAFYPFSSAPQSAAYAVPFAAVFLTRLHLVELGRRPGARRAGALWLAALAVAGACVTVNAARTHTVSVAGPGGTILTTAPAGRVYAEALRWIDRDTRPGDAVLLAPQLTSLYALSERTDPVPQISLLPGTLPSVSDQRDEITVLRRSGVRLAVIDRHQFPEYGHTSFGESFDRTLAAWIRRSFVHVATLTAPGPDGRTLDVWLRGTQK